MNITRIKKIKDRGYSKLVDNGMFQYGENSDRKTIFSFCKKDDETAIVYLEYDKLLNKYVFSYPMKGTMINYNAKFNTLAQAEEYVDYILNQDVIA
jgi:hypothetical protein